MISTAILTFQEEQDLPSCLASLGWCDDIHVIDSGSTDRTVALAAEAGATVSTHPFESFGRQRNWALENCCFKHSWVLFLDADERSTREFHQAALAAVGEAPEEVAGFYCCWKMMLYGRWLRRCDSFPKWQFRLLRRGRAAFADFGHGQKECQVQGRLEYLRTPYLHFAYSKGWAPWLERHNRYSSLEARERSAAPVRWREVFSHHGSVRNKALKPLVSRIPGWPAITFLVRYFAKLGFLEGRAGFVYCVNMAYYEFLIQLKIREQKEGMDGKPAGDSASLINVIFFTGLLGILYFALKPAAHGSRLHELPWRVEKWINEHDDLANYVVFLVFSAVTFLLPCSPLESRLAGRWRGWPVRLVLLLALVSGLEVAQLFIPGRVSSLRDVATGSAGVLTSLALLSAWWQWRRKSMPPSR